LDSSRKSLNEAVDLLKSLRLRDDEIKTCIYDGLRLLREGGEPFVKNYPFDGQKIYYFMRDWEKTSAYKSLTQPRKNETSTKNP